MWRPSKVCAGGRGWSVGSAIHADPATLDAHEVAGYVTGASVVVDGGLSLTNWFAPPELD